MNLESAKQSVESAWLSEVRRQIGSLHFGSVQIVVHEGRVVQVEKTERVRFNKNGRAASDDAASGERLV